MSKAEAEALKLKTKLQREQLYLVIMRPKEDAIRASISNAQIRLEHHNYLLELERQGVLFAAGPLRDDEDQEKESGLLILRTKTRAGATEIARDEPYTKYGLREFKVIPWQRNEGTLSLNIRLADGILEFDSRRWSIGPVDCE